jgi:hypothetical protein
MASSSMLGWHSLTVRRSPSLEPICNLATQHMKEASTTQHGNLLCQAIFMKLCYSLSLARPGNIVQKLCALPAVGRKRPATFGTPEHSSTLIHLKTDVNSLSIGLGHFMSVLKRIPLTHGLGHRIVQACRVWPPAATATSTSTITHRTACETCQGPSSLRLRCNHQHMAPL